MKPYYDDGKGIAIYHGDCKEGLPMLPKVDLVLTDPAYGINADRDRNSQVNGWRDYGATGWDKERTPPSLIFMALDAAENAIIWGGNYFTDCLPPSMGWLAWDKGQIDFSLADFELAWTSFHRASRRLMLPRAAVKDGREHPTQKPLKLMTWCLNFAPDAQTVIDPFMGSGTTLRACKDLGRKCIGIELEERYCEIAAKRMAQEVFDFTEPFAFCEKAVVAQ